MTTDRWRRIETLYHEMLARPGHERAAALVAACRGDAGLQAEVQSLLDQESATGFLSTPAAEVAAPVLSQPAASVPAGSPRRWPKAPPMRRWCLACRTRGTCTGTIFAAWAGAWWRV